MWFTCNFDVFELLLNFGRFPNRSYHEPLDDKSRIELTFKQFSGETMKKIRWVTNMYRDWRMYRNANPNLLDVKCDIDQMEGVSKSDFVDCVCKFITEVKKIDGSDYPGKTLYDIVICLQFHLETKGYSWKLLGMDDFRDVRFTLDNLMKQRCAAGIGVNVRKAEVLTGFHEELFWSLGLFGTHDPNTLLNTLVYMLGKGFALRAGQEHRCLKSPQFSSQLSFLHDDEGCVFVRYTEEAGFKTNKGGLKHRRVEPKVVDMYAIEDVNKCPVRLLLYYLSKVPQQRSTQSLYLQPVKKYSPGRWFHDRPVGANKLREVVKDIAEKAGLPGFYSNHSLRSTSATKLYRGNFDEQLIQEITGHRSLAVRSYKRTSDGQRKDASKCIFSN